MIDPLHLAVDDEVSGLVGRVMVRRRREPDRVEEVNVPRLMHQQESDSAEEVRLGRLPPGEARRVDEDTPPVGRPEGDRARRFPAESEEGLVGLRPVLFDPPESGGQ